jgi:DNA repair exonuclease SbcCD ATPase subunit
LLAAELKEIKKNINGYDFDNTKDIIKNIFQKFLKQNIKIIGIINKNKYIKAEKIIPLFQNITDNIEKNINEKFFNGDFEKTEILKNENRKLEEETEKTKKENEELKKENELLLSKERINKEYAKKLKEEKQKVENINNNLSSDNETLKEDLEIKKEIITEIREKNIIIKNYYDDIKKLYELNISKIETFKELNEELKDKFEALTKAKKPFISSLRGTNDITNAMLFGGIPIMVNMLIDVYNYQNKLNNQSIKKDIEKLKKKKEQLSKKISEGFEEYNFLKEEVKKVKKEKEELKEKIKPKRKIQMRTM